MFQTRAKHPKKSRRLVTDSYAAQLETLPHNSQRKQQNLLRQLLEEQDVRAATQIGRAHV